MYFLVECLCLVDDIQCGELISELNPCADIVFFVYIESGTKVLNNPG